MSMFADRGRVAVQFDDSPNIIYIRPEMSVKMRGELTDAVRIERDDAGNVITGNGAASTALLQTFVCGWSGPGFHNEHGVLEECTPAMVAELKANDPLVARVLEEIARRVNPLGKPTTSSPTDGAQS